MSRCKKRTSGPLSPILCFKSILARLVQSTVDGSEQAQRHVEGRYQRNDLDGKPFQTTASGKQLYRS